MAESARVEAMLLAYRQQGVATAKVKPWLGIKREQRGWIEEGMTKAEWYGEE